MRYGKGKYTNPNNNNTTNQQERMERLRRIRDNERMDGRKRKDIELFDVLQARAKMLMNKAADLEGRGGVQCHRGDVSEGG